MRLVLDTSIVVAGVRSRLGASYQILSMIPHTQWNLLLSVPLFLEYEEVLKRPEQRQVHGLSETDIDVLLSVWAHYAEPVEFRYLWRPLLRDAKDEMVLETAANGQARALVNFNTKNFRPTAGRFGVELWTPGETLNRLRGGL